MILGRTIVLDPTPERAARLRRACGTARFAYNWASAANLTHQRAEAVKRCAAAETERRSPRATRSALAGVRLPRDHSVRFPDSAAFVASSFQGFVGDFRPELFQRRRCRLMRVPFGIIRRPRHLIRLP
jgi:hypothetical protein